VLRATSHHATFTGPGLDIAVEGYESLEAHPGAGGTDVAFLYDSKEDDHFYTDGTQAVLTGPDENYRLAAVGFPYAHGYASRGYDTAEMHGAPGDDTFVFHKHKATMIGAEGAFYTRSKHFEHVTAVSDPWESTVGDAAYLHDAESDDVFTAAPDESTMELGVGHDGSERTAATTVIAQNFRYVHGYARYGGTDVARLKDSPGGDVLVAKPEWAKLSNDEGLGNDYLVRAKLFEETHSDATAGHDVAYMYDSPGRDVFVGRPEWSRMYGLDAKYDNRANAFEEVYSHAIYGGDDRAELYDSEAEDRLEAAPDHWAKVYSAPGSALDYLYYARGFEEAEAWSTDEDDEAGVDAETAEWLFTHDWQ